MTRLKSPQLTADGLPASEPSQAPSVTLSASTGLPTLNVAQDAVLTRELTNRLDQFKTFVEVVVAEINGQAMRYDQIRAERVLKHEQDLSELDLKHSQAISELERQQADLLRGVRRLERSLAEEDRE